MKLHPMIIQGAFLAGYMHKQAFFETFETDPSAENTISGSALKGAGVGAGVGAAGGAGVQAIKNTLEGKEHKLKDYLKAILIGGGVGAAGGAGIGAVRGADAENARQNKARGDVMDTLIEVNKDRRPIPRLQTEDQALDQNAMIELMNKLHHKGQAKGR
jgi:hypothetical protein